MKSIMYFLDYGRSYGGASHTLMQQALLMRRSGYKIYIVISSYYGSDIDASYQRICDSHDIYLYKIPFVMTYSPEDINYIEMRNHFEKVKEFVKYYMPDLLHSVQLNITVELVSRELNIPHIMNIYQAKQSFFPFQYLDILPRYHICDSELYMKVWENNLGCRSCCIRTYAQNTELRKIKKSKLIFLCVGMLCGRKNQLEVIKAFELLYEKGVNAALILCGDDNSEYGAACKNYVAENGLSEIVIFAGFCVDINEYYNNADILVCGSRIESYPNVISEALASNCVVVSTPVGGVPEVIKDGENGYLCNGFDASCIVKKMEKAVKDYCRVEGDIIKEAAKRTYQANHSEKAVFDALKTYYDFVAEDYQKRKREGEIKYEELNRIFTPLLDKYNEYIDLILDPVFTSYKLWYLYYAEKILTKDFGAKKIYLWGTDWTTIIITEMLAVFIPQLEIEGYIGCSQETMFLGKTVCSADVVLKEEGTMILIATESGQELIEKMLDKHGKICGRDYLMMAIRIW